MLDLNPGDESLVELVGKRIESDPGAAVRYLLLDVIGQGGTAVAFLALRETPDGHATVVLKVVRPSVARSAGERAALMVRKEAVALGRLNEQIPPTPFVVRLIDTGAVSVRVGLEKMKLPWLAVEYVHGGLEGSTLIDRVEYSMQRTSFAFDPDRAALAITCIARGLEAVHAAGIIHRDVKPGNVLCCGFGEDEIFKIADFGIARPRGMLGTFTGLAIGTPGYAAPEQYLLDSSRTGPTSDVFAMGALIYYLLTGTEYFQCLTPVDGIAQVRKPERRRLIDGPGLTPELRERPDACATIDSALARATAVEAEHRPQSAEILARMILPAMRPDSPSRRLPERRVRAARFETPTASRAWAWNERFVSHGGKEIRSVAWDGDGRCLAATQSGLCFWNGTDWLDAPTHELQPQAMRFIRRIAGAKWLIGGDDALLAVYTPSGVSEYLTRRSPGLVFEQGSGDPADLAVFAVSSGGTLFLQAMAGRRWLKPTLLPQVAGVTSLARVADTAWIVTGRTHAGEGFVARYQPLMWDVTGIPAPRTLAYVASAAQAGAERAVVVGTNGRTMRLDERATAAAIIDGEPNLSAVSLDFTGGACAGGSGALWMQTAQDNSWMRVWENPRWIAPFVSIMTDAGLVVAITAEGGIVEGRRDGGV